jgi:hypothetical protein
MTRRSFKPNRLRTPRRMSAYRLRFVEPAENAYVMVLMAYDADHAMRTARELHPNHELLSCRLLEQW